MCLFVKLLRARWIGFDERNDTLCDETPHASTLRACHVEGGSLAVCDILWCIGAPLQSANFQKNNTISR
jgi:hypothetical protein